MAEAAENLQKEEQLEAHDDDLPLCRPRRQKPDKTGRSAALKRLREAKQKGEKHKAEISEAFVPVYEELNESEYSELVRERQDDDWIVDDGTGYVEDGREIFDDDDAEVDQKCSRGNSKGKLNKYRPKNPNVREAKKNNLKSYFSAASVGSKKLETEKNSTVEDDNNILGEMLGVLHTNTPKIRPFLPTVQTNTSGKSSLMMNPFATSRNFSSQKRDPSSPLKEPSPVKPKQTKIPRSSVVTGRKNLDLSAETAAPDLISVEDTSFQRISSNMSTDQVSFANLSPEENMPDTEPLETGSVVAGADGLEDGQPESKVRFAPPETAADGLRQNRGFRNAADGKQSSSLEDFECVSSVTDTPVPDVSVIDRGCVPLCTSIDGTEVLKIFWMDAYEDTFRNPGSVYLFGRVWVSSPGIYASCCVIVKNIEKVLFFLPRDKRFVNGNETEEELGFGDVYNEIKEFLSRHGISEFRIKKSCYKYAFDEPDVPSEADYLEVHYDMGKFKQAIPLDSKGETFSRVFGSTSSGLELLSLKRQLKGPGWLEIRNFRNSSPQVSWCTFEVVINDINSLEIVQHSDSPPKVSIATLNVLALPSLKNNDQEIVAVSMLVHRNFAFDKPQNKMLYEESYCFICKPSNSVLPFDFKEQKQRAGMKYVEIVGNERALLNLLLAKIQKIDPDIFVGHDILGFGLDLILHRLTANKVPNWSRIGRLRRSGPAPKNASTKSGLGDALAGRICIDVEVAAKELIRCKSYELSELSQRLLDTDCSDLHPSQASFCYSTSNTLLDMIRKLMTDTVLILRIMGELSCLPLFLQITQIVGGVMSRTVMGGRSERNEFLLLHAFHDKGYIVPDKSLKKKVQEAKMAADEGEIVEKDAKKKVSYVGGLVLDPKKGLYDCYVLLLDFNSLYPSIMQEFNICFTTVDRGSKANVTTDSEIPNVPDPKLPAGILPTEIRKLVDSRKEVKKLMKMPNLTSEQAMQYNIRQMALKLTANSMYGCLGFAQSRFYAKPLAALITAKGREILLHTKELVERLGLEVIYGDTDSIMINSNSYDLDEVMKQGKKVKQEVNKLYRLLELDIDGVYRSLLLLKKKKYAGLAVENLPNGQTKLRRELKGLDIVRRDWSGLAKDAGNFVIDEILSAKPRETILDNIHQHLIEFGEQIRNGDLELGKFEISKQLTKSPKEYTDKKAQPHVLVALRLNENGKAHYKQGDTVSYVICQDGTVNPATQRAYSKNELQENEDLKIDLHYYLSQQVHPVVSRLCDPIEGTDSGKIAECLGLDASGYRQKSSAGGGDGDDFDAAGPSIDLSHCDPFLVTCPKPDCSRTIQLTTAFVGQGSSIDFALAKCSNPKCEFVPADALPYLLNQLQISFRRALSSYYAGWLSCEDLACSFRTRRVPVRLSHDGYLLCQSCQQSNMQQEVSEKQLFAQLSFYQRLFDIDKALEERDEFEKARINRICTTEIRKAYAELKEYIDDILLRNAYSEVNLGKIFECLLSCF